MTSNLAPRPRLTSGRIAYRNAAGNEIGRERFEIISHDGGHIMRALCEMDEIGLLRDVTTALDLDWRPRDGFCRVIKHGKTAVTTWFGVEPGAIAVESIRDGVRLSQRLPTAYPLLYLGLHPVQGDGMVVQARGESDPGVFVTIAAITNSISPNGDEELYGMPCSIDVAFIGHETVTIAAGTFEARRFALRWREDWPPANLWVRKEDCVFLLMRWSLIPNWYELTAIEDN